MRVLVACERSGRIRDALIARGHNAWSCDLMPSRSPGPHLQCDVREVLYERWDMLIAHPVCRYLTNTASLHLYIGKHKENGPEPERWRLMREAAEFFLLFDRATHIPKRAIENPIMHCHAIEIIGRRATQYVQPWMFGDPFQKATGFWLTGLPKLIPERRKDSYDVEIKQECWRMAPGPDREELRSNTYPGIARAIAE
jgi:hypothetical protein